MRTYNYFRLFISALPLMLLLSSLSASAQISVTYIQKNPFEFKKQDARDFQVLNSGQTEWINIAVQVKDASGELYRASVIGYECKPGLTQASGLIFEGEQISGTGGFKMTGSLDPGNYEWCVTVTKVANSEELYQNCFNVDVLGVTPPMLIYPANQSVVNSLNPQLIWMGPVVSGKSQTKFLFDLKLCEILPGQAAFDALNQNFALYSLKGVKQTEIQYPFTAAKLQNGKSYAWQVVASNSNGYRAETEIWTFTVQTDTFKEPDVVFFEGFIIPQKTESEGLLNIRNELKLSFSESYELNNLSYEILNDGKVLKLEIPAEYIEGAGFNKAKVKLEKIRDLKSKSTYYLRITNRNTNEQYLVRFKFYRSW